MMNKRPERDLVEKAFVENRRRKAHEIAEEVGLIEAMGYDKAIDYVRSVKKSMKEKGQIKPAHIASDAERLQDVTKLFEIRKGKIEPKTAYMMLLLNCYYRFRSQDDSIHMMAIDDTYEKNAQLKEPFHITEAIKICDAALAQYMNSIDEDQNEAAKKKGFPGAGLNYTDDSFIERLAITDSELEHMKSIRRE